MFVTVDNLGPDFFMDSVNKKIILTPESDTRVKGLHREGDTIVLTLNNGETLSVSISQDGGD